MRTCRFPLKFCLGGLEPLSDSEEDPCEAERQRQADLMDSLDEHKKSQTPLLYTPWRFIYIIYTGKMN